MRWITYTTLMMEAIGNCLLFFMYMAFAFVVVIIVMIAGPLLLFFEKPFNMDECSSPDH